MSKASKKIADVHEKTSRIANTQQYHDARFTEKHQVCVAVRETAVCLQSWNPSALH